MVEGLAFNGFCCFQILLSALVALSTAAPSYEQYAPAWATYNDEPSLGLVAPAPYSNRRSGESEQAMPSMVNLFLMTDPEMAGKTVEAVLRTEDKILQERSLNTEVAEASENVKRQVPIDITKISLTTEESADGTDYNIAPQSSDSSVVDEEAEKLKQMTPPSVESANVVLEGNFNSYKPEEVVEAKSSDSAAAVAPSEFKVTKDTIFEPKDPSFSYDSGPNHSGIDISKISLTNETPEVNEAAPVSQEAPSYSTTGNDGVNSVPAALQENTWTKYPLAALIEEFMRGG